MQLHGIRAEQIRQIEEDELIYSSIPELAQHTRTAYVWYRFHFFSSFMLCLMIGGRRMERERDLLANQV